MISIQNSVAKEKPKSATAVKKTLITVTMLAPSFRVNLSEKRLERMVHPEITIVTMPIEEIETPNVSCITGQPEPKSESGNRD